jgi:hypothetical protein
MTRKKALIALAVITALGVLGISSAAWSSCPEWRRNCGGFVLPCSLDGVNPAVHPAIFGNPTLAYKVYGFVRARDGTWYVENNCRRGLNHN